ncbi:MAG TPA: hypothetical protein VHL50_02375 [Pyrinomonadaceae bacterium]|jgi:hypothetical protein|nr:hypothetical protein [Pyrinomonadaceae bacterium]
MESQTLWEVEVEGRVYCGELTEIIDWINEGAVLPRHKVRRGNLRWLPAKRVPELSPHFKRVVRSGAEASGAEGAESVHGFENFGTQIVGGAASSPATVTPAQPERKMKPSRFCVAHRELRSEYVCGVCRRSYCRICPKRYGSDVRLCPSCGAVCITFVEAQNNVFSPGAINRPYARKDLAGEDDRKFFDTKIQPRDIWESLAYPLHARGDLAVAAVIFVPLFAAMITALRGSVVNVAAAAAAVVVAAGIAFSMLSSVCRAEKLQTDRLTLLPRFRDGLDGILRPLGQAIAVAAASFGLFAVLAAGSAGYAWTQFSASVDLVENEIRAAAARQAAVQPAGEVDSVVRERRWKIVDSVVGESGPEVESVPIRIVRAVMMLSVTFLAPMGIAFVLGVILLPAACGAVVEKSSARPLLNPVNALRVLKQYGFDYIKLLAGLLIAIVLTLGVGAAGLLAVQALAEPLAAVSAFALLAGAAAAYSCIAWSRLLAIEVHRELED